MVGDTLPVLKSLPPTRHSKEKMKTLFEQLIKERVPKEDRFTINTKRQLFKAELRDDYAFIVTNWVNKTERGKGLGAKAVDRFEEWVLGKGVDTIRLEAEEVAIEFWKRMGYKTVSGAKTGAPSTTMWKELK